MKLNWFLTIVVAGLLAGCSTDDPQVTYNKMLTSPGEKYAGLPPAVQHTVRAQVGMAEIADIQKNTASGMVVYEVRFRETNLYPPLYIDTDGSVLTSNLDVAVGAGGDPIGAVSGGAASGVKFEELPASVIKTIQEKSPTAEILFINKTTVGDTTLYEVTFKNSYTNPKMLIGEDGTVVKKSSTLKWVPPRQSAPEPTATTVPAVPVPVPTPAPAPTVTPTPSVPATEPSPAQPNPGSP
jgi:hypothetical protein